MQFTFIENGQQYPFRGSHVKTFQKADFILIVPMCGDSIGAILITDLSTGRQVQTQAMELAFSFSYHGDDRFNYLSRRF